MGSSFPGRGENKQIFELRPASNTWRIIPESSWQPPFVSHFHGHVRKGSHLSSHRYQKWGYFTDGFLVGYPLSKQVDYEEGIKVFGRCQTKDQNDYGSAAPNFRCS